MRWYCRYAEKDGRAAFKPATCQKLMKGIIHIYRPKRGDGFIRIPGTDEFYYFRRVNCLDSIRRGDAVTFSLRTDQNGVYADRIRLYLLG